MSAALLAAARAIGKPRFGELNGRVMQDEGSHALTTLQICHGRRHPIFRTYVHALLGHPNLTVLTDG